MQRDDDLAQLVADALVMAIWRRGRPRALLHHSDRGSQYTSEHFHCWLLAVHRAHPLRRSPVRMA
jgi:transposase InsO family protein